MSIEDANVGGVNWNVQMVSLVFELLTKRYRQLLAKLGGMLFPLADESLNESFAGWTLNFQANVTEATYIGHRQRRVLPAQPSGRRQRARSFLNCEYGNDPVPLRKPPRARHSYQNHQKKQARRTLLFAQPD